MFYIHILMSINSLYHSYIKILLNLLMVFALNIYFVLDNTVIIK